MRLRRQNLPAYIAVMTLLAELLPPLKVVELLLPLELAVLLLPLKVAVLLLPPKVAVLPAVVTGADLRPFSAEESVVLPDSHSLGAASFTTAAAAL